ncbi:MAG: acyl-CoA dehydrogenase family protein [Gammaproteobacteria bacterium]
MELSLSSDQRALLDSLEPLLEHHREIPQSERRSRCYYSRGLERDLADAGYLDILRTEGNTALEAALVVDAVAALPVTAEVATSVLVAPQVLPPEVPRPFSILYGPITRPQRFLPVARTALYDTGDDVLVIDVDPANVEAVEAIFAYPFGKFRTPPDLSKARRLGAASVAKFRQWARVALAVECAAAGVAATKFTVEYVKQRIIFNRPLGSYQAVQHRLASCHQLASGARLLALRAAWSGSPTDAALAATYAQMHIDRIRFDTHQFNGGMGLSNEHLLHFWTYRMVALASELGGAGANAIAAAGQAFAA